MKIKNIYNYHSFKIAFIYFVFSLLWILFSDSLVEIFAKKIEILAFIQTIKGGLFVLVTSIIIYYLIKRELDKKKHFITLLKEEEAKYRLLFENANDVFFLLKDDIFIDCNLMMSEVFLCRKNDIIGKTPYAFSPEYQPNGKKSEYEAKKHIHQAKNGNRHRFEWKHKRLNGELFDADVTLNPVDIGGEHFVHAIVRDISKIKASEKALKESEQRYRAQIDNFPLPVYTLEKKGDRFYFVDVNIAAKNNPYVKAVKTLGHPIDDFFGQEDKELIKYIRDSFESQKPNKLGKLYKYKTTGIKRYVNFYCGYVPPKYVLLFTEDITENKKSLDALIESEKKFRLIFNSVLDGISIVNPAGKIIEANKAMLERLGYSKEELMEISYQDRFPKENKEKIDEILSKIHSQGALSFETEHGTKGGKTIPIEMYSRLIDYEGHPAIISVSRDITERKLTQKRIFNAVIKAEETERGRLAKELHDGVSPILSAVKLFIQSMIECKDPKLREEINQKAKNTIREAIQSLSDISNNLSPHILQNFGLIEAVNSFINKLSGVTNIHFDISSNFSDRLDENIEFTLYRVVTELINNTIKHAGAKNVTLNFYKNEYLFVTYSDDGKGYEVGKIYKKKSGMGLFNIINRIKSLDGDIIFDTEHDKVTKVMIKLPLLSNQE